MAESCFDDPGRIFEEKFCLSALSKNLRGELEKLDEQRIECRSPKCVTFRTIHRLKVAVKGNRPCDGPLGPLFDDTFLVEKLVTALETDGESRGIHSGDFLWIGPGLEARGRISGMTNAGTHRKPVFDPCQDCHAPGYMEGRLCGVITKAPKPELDGCHIVGTYRIRFDPSKSFISTAIEGTIEAELICPCR